ncbi:LamG-like jellyroll fold domain-containing protein [Tenacibaculum sp. 190524A02b]
MKNKYTLLVGFLLVICSSFSLVHAQQDNDLAVLHVQSKGKYNRIFNPNTNLKELLEKGDNNKATIEFWGMHNGHSSSSTAPLHWYVTNFKEDNKAFSVHIKEDQISLQLGSKVFKQSLFLQERLFRNVWNHYAITVDVGAKEIRTYINGTEILYFKPDNIDVEDLYFVSDPKTDLFLAEFRAWSVTKTKEQIKLQQYRSFYKQSKNTLGELKNNGLQVIYTNTSQKHYDYFGGDVLITTSWNNLLYSHFPSDNLVRNASFTSAYKKIDVGRIGSDIAHPILNLNKIIVRASDGDGSDHALLSGTNGVVISWLHVKGSDAYQILRRNIRSGTNSILIETINELSNKQPSEELLYVDKSILPNELYEYTIQAKKNGANTLTGKDNGFVLPNGKVSGIIETSSSVPTKFAKVEAKAATNPGRALQVEKGATPIFIKNIEAFRKARAGATLEFWYKTPKVEDGENKVVKIGNAELVLTKNNITINLGGKKYLGGIRTSDTKWHHYAFTFGAKGGMLFEDGKLINNASTTNLFAIDLSEVNSFCLSADTKIGYYLDEVRFWNVPKTSVEIEKYAKHIVGGIEPNLFAYYRFDFNDPNRAYNFSSSRKGQYLAESEGRLKRLAAAEQPKISYATYTNEKGNYEFTSLSTGIQGVTNNDTKFEYTIEPSKSRFKFSPKTQLAKVNRKLNDAGVIDKNFTDISSLPITGVISYKVGDESYPVIKGTSLLVDGSVIQSTEDAKVTTDNNGVYAIKAAPGKHIITPNPVPPINKVERLNEGSLRFDGKTGYVRSSSSVGNQGNSFTWSGFLRPYVKQSNEDKVPDVQTVLQWGNLSLKLIKNATLKVYIGTQEKLSKDIETSAVGQFSFFSISFNKENATLSLYVDDKRTNTSLSALIIESNLIIGSEKESGKFINFSKIHIDLLEYRAISLLESDMLKLKEGKYLENEKSNLKLSYRFDQKYGTKAINTAYDDENNKYLQFEGGCSFDNKTFKQYIREVQYSYKATNATFNPKGNHYEVVLEEPLQNLNFENTTRHSFIGNIVVPCNNNVGNWTGKIVRTDIAHPKFEKNISTANFNSDNTVFTINDLLPGQYRVEITNTGSNRKVQSPIIDLRRENITYDFTYRNPMEIEVEFFSFDAKEASKYNSVSDIPVKKVNSTCGNFVFESLGGLKMNVNVFERYGENKCPVSGADVSIDGDAIVKSSKFKSKTLNKGVLELYSQVNSPNFSGDHTRSFVISAAHNGRNQSITKKAIITGTIQNNSDFTLTEPQVGFVLHDPPGDNSFATLTKGATYSNTISAENGGGTTIDNSIGAKVRVKKQIITGGSVGIGVAVIKAFLLPVLQLSTDNAGVLGTEFSYAGHSGSSETVTLEKSISTPSDPTYVGEDADVFIGTSRVLSFGTGKEVALKGCSPEVRDTRKVVKPSSATPFVYTKQSLVDVIIPNLYRLAIARYDNINGIVSPPKDRDHIDLKGTLEKLLTKKPKDKNDTKIVDYLHQIKSWEDIIAKNHEKRKEKYFKAAPGFSNTTKKLTNGNDVGESGAGLNASVLDRRITFDALTEISYTLSRAKTKSSGNSSSTNLYTGVQLVKDYSLAGVGFTLNNESRVYYTNNSSESDENENSRVDSFTLNDDDAGDHFDVLIRRDPDYDTPMFLTKAGRSSCPFESGTVPREGVELIVDKVVGYGTGDESILYNLTLRNTQIAKDATRKTYIVGMAGASNSLGAVVNLNESPIFEPTTSSKFVFDLDPSSPTGVKQEIKAQLRIARGTDAPSVISYENIKIQMYSECEQGGDRYRSYGEDEYKEVGVKPLSEILVTAHFTGACIEEVEADAPQNDWIVNGSDKKELDFTFRIPELKDKPDTDDFSVDLEYTIKGNNTPRILKKLDLKTLKENLDADTDQVSYSADVSALTDGEYSFRIVPVCGDGGSDNPNNRKNPTPFVKGKIARNAPKLVLTTPDNGGIHTSGTISAKFSAPINPATVNLNSLAMRGVLGGVPKPLTSVKLDHVNDLITIPHDNRFNLEDKATIEMWINPAKYPTSGSVPILHKGNNFGVLLASDGKIDLGNGVKSSVGLQAFTWTHIAVVADKVNGNATIYFNGNPVGSGKISTVLKTNEAPIVIAPVINGDAFVGSLDEIRLWRSLRTPAQIASNMKNQLLGNEDTLEAYFVFNDNTLAKQGVNGNPNEAIQDFTGNASGTTAQSIEFVTNEAAAPLDQTKTVEDIQFETTMSEGNTVINFNMKIEDLEFVEGASLTVFVKDKKLEDPLGNKVDKTSWSFIVDRSKLKWSQNNISVTQKQGEATTIDTIDLINKDGGVDVAYTFENLPVWFEVKSGANATEGVVNTIKARETNSNLVFEIKSFLNPGIHSANIYIKTSNKTTGVKLGVESFRVEVLVTCPEPEVSQSFKNDYPFTMDFKGNLLIKNQKSLDVNDVVTAYIGNTPRGYAKVASNGLVNLTVFGNADETNALSFRIWDASECTEYEGILENYSFAFNTRKGTDAMPVTFTVGNKVKRRIPVVQGFQELSFNLKDTKVANTLSLTAIKGLPVASEILDITNPSQKAVVGANGSFTGNLTAIDISKAYLVKVATNTVKYIEIVGVPVSLNTNLAIVGGNVSNALPFYPNNLERTSYAVRSFTATKVSAGDRIERRGLFAEYSTTEGWKGSLTHLTPGLGYIFKAKNAGAINYSGIATNAPQARFAAKGGVLSTTVKEQIPSQLEATPSYKDLGMVVNENAYANFMYINGKLVAEDMDNTKAYTILAMVDNELRGASKAELINDEYHYYLGVGSNQEETVQFKLYDGNQLVDLTNEETFVANQSLGTLTTPYVFNIAHKNEVVKENEVSLTLAQNKPNPMVNHTEITFTLPKDAHAELHIYNMVGQNLGTLHSGKFTKGKHAFNWNGVVEGKKLPEGTYVYDLNVEGKRLYRKLVIIK